jgi:hypothetical protein
LGIPASLVKFIFDRLAILALIERRDQLGSLAAAAQPQNALTFSLDDIFVVQLRQRKATHRDLPELPKCHLSAQHRTRGGVPQRGAPSWSLCMTA